MNSTDTILKIINEGMEKKDRYVTLFLMKWYKRICIPIRYKK